MTVTSYNHPAVDRAAIANGIDPNDAANLLLPDDARMLDEQQRAMRAKLLADIYATGLSLQTVGDIAGGLSKERVRQILLTNGYITRPVPGSKRWREARYLANVGAH